MICFVRYLLLLVPLGVLATHAAAISPASSLTTSMQSHNNHHKSNQTSVSPLVETEQQGLTDENSLKTPAAFDAELVDFLFFDGYLSGQSLNASIDLITSDYEQFYVSFSQFNELLQFHLQYENEQLSGWYLTERNQIAINFLSQQGNRLEDVLPIKPYHWVNFDGELYLSTLALAEWFEIETDIRANKLLINFRPKQQHPMIARLKRQEKHKLRGLKMNHQASFPTVADIYHGFTIPSFDINLSPSWQKAQGVQNRLNVSSNTDILWHSAALQFSNNDSNQKGRITLSREGEWRGLPFYYQLGDVYGVSNPFLSSGLGRGVMFGRSDQASQQRNTRRFEGPAPDGWEAELYRGDTALAYQVVEDGFFRFDNIPTTSGRNSFYVQLYGPTGEQQRIDYEFNTAQMIVQEGDWFPEFSWQQGGRSMVFDTATNQRNTFSAMAHYGLSKSHSVSFGYIHQSVKALNNTNANTTTDTVPDIERLTATLSGYSTRMRYDLDIGYDEFTHGLGVNLDTNWLFNDFDIQLNYKDLSGIDESSLPSASLSYTPFEPNIEHSFAVSFNKTEQGWKQNWAASVGWRNKQWQLSANADYQPKEGSNLSTQVNWRGSGHQLQLQNTFAITPNAEVTSTRFSHRMKLGTVSLQTGINANWQQHSLQYSLSLSQQFEWFRMGAQLTTDDKDSYRVGLNFSFSTEFYPTLKWPSAKATRQNATIFASAYIDENYNGQRDNHESNLPNVRFKGRSHWRHSPSSAEQDARLTQANSRIAQKVQLDPLSLDNPFLFTANETLLVDTHAGGENSVAFRLIQVTEVEGEIAVLQCPEPQEVIALQNSPERENSPERNNSPELIKNLKKPPARKLKNLGGVPIKISRADGSMKQHLHSEFDGFFLLEKIIPDTYQFSISQSFLDKKNLQAFAPFPIVVTPEAMQDIITLETIVLVEKCE